MSVLATLAEFGKKVYDLTKRVDENAEEIQKLHKQVNALTKFSIEVKGALVRNRQKIEDYQKMSDYRHESLSTTVEKENRILTQSLELELLKLERRLSASRQQHVLLSNHNDHDSNLSPEPADNSDSS